MRTPGDRERAESKLCCTVAERKIELRASEINKWLGREAHMPGRAHVLTNEADISSALKDSISAVRRQKHH